MPIIEASNKKMNLTGDSGRKVGASGAKQPVAKGNGMHEEKVLDRSYVRLRRGVSRGEFLKMSGASLAGLALLGVAAPAFAEKVGMVSASELGISPKNGAEQNRTNLVNALWNSSKNVTFPRGDYLLDNTGPLYISKYTGTLKMEPGARFVFTHNAKRGLTFADSVGARFEGLTVTYRTLPSRRDPEHAGMVFERGKDNVILKANINGSGAGGLSIVQSIRPKVDGAVIRNTMGDGLYIHNCQDVRVNDLLIENTGDDALSIHNFANNPNYTGARASNIKIRNGGTRGIVIGGQSDVLVEHFDVDTTYATGIIVYRDEYWNTRTPSNVRFAHGAVRNAGKGRKGTGAGSAGKYGIEFYKVKSAEFDDIQVAGSVSRGVSGFAPSGVVKIERVTSTGAGDSGFTLSAKELVLDRLTARSSMGTGIGVVNCGKVKYGALESVNTSKKNGLHRAFNFENNRQIEGSELNLTDDQKKPTGFKLSTSGRQGGRLGVVRDRVAHGDAEIDNHSNLAVNRSRPR